MYLDPVEECLRTENFPGPSNRGHTLFLLNSNKHPKEKMSTVGPRLLSLNISGAIYGKVPGPLLTHVTVDSVNRLIFANPTVITNINFLYVRTDLTIKADETK